MTDAIPRDTSALGHDIRMLKLAEMYEEAYENFVVQMATHVIDDDSVRAELMRLVDPADGHGERIQAHLERLNALVTPQHRTDIMLAALGDVCEVERSARDFYRSHAPDIQDAGVRRLFEQLAQEEEHHFQIATAALRKARRAAGLPEDEGYPASFRARLFPPPGGPNRAGKP